MLYEASIEGTSTTGAASSVSEYYGKTLTGTSSLQTNACCTSKCPPDHLLRLMENIHDEVVGKYYGCGFVCPLVLEGCRVLDLGCGAGRDVYILSQMVGPNGSVVGVDFTPEQLAVGRAHLDWHMERFGFTSSKPNVEFVEASIEDLRQLPDASFDVIVSNCVVNLCQNKRAVFQEAFRLLKQGGEMYFSDVYSSQRVPLSLRIDPVLWGECLSGALYWNDFLRLAKECGFKDPRLVEDSPITINKKSLESKVGNITFFSATYRCWKIFELEPDCEDYEQAVVYRGTVENHPFSFTLDDHHTFPTGKIFPVCGNTYRMINQTRFQKAFDLFGDFTSHFGLFEGCGKAIPFVSAASSGGSSSSNGASCC